MNKEMKFDDLASMEAELSRILSQHLAKEIDKQIIADLFSKNRIRKD